LKSEDVLLLEATAGITLPHDFRQYLLTIGWAPPFALLAHPVRYTGVLHESWNWKFKVQPTLPGLGQEDPANGHMWLGDGIADCHLFPSHDGGFYKDCKGNPTLYRRHADRDGEVYYTICVDGPSKGSVFAFANGAPDFDEDFAFSWRLGTFLDFMLMLYEPVMDHHDAKCHVMLATTLPRIKYNDFHAGLTLWTCDHCRGGTEEDGCRYYHHHTTVAANVDVVLWNTDPDVVMSRYTLVARKPLQLRTSF
jgi:hypothetical protein